MLEGNTSFCTNANRWLVANSRDTQMCILICDVNYALRLGTDEVKGCLRTLRALDCVVYPAVFEADRKTPRDPALWFHQVFDEAPPEAGWPSRSVDAAAAYEAALKHVPPKWANASLPPRKDVRWSRSIGRPPPIVLTPGPGDAGEAAVDKGPPDPPDEPPERIKRPPSKVRIARAFAALKVGITREKILTVIHVAPADRLWVSLGLTHLTAAHSLGRYLEPYGAVSVEALIAGMIIQAVNDQGEAGCWRSVGRDWIFKVYPAMDADEVQEVFSRWAEMCFLLHYLRCTSPNRAETLRPVFLVNRQKRGKGFPKEAWISLPLPVAADVALLVRKHGDERSERARAGDVRSPKRQPTFIDGTWAAFPGDCAASFVPLAKFQHVRQPERSDPAATLAWHRYYNTEPPPTEQLLDHFRRDLEEAPDGHRLVAAR